MSVNFILGDFISRLNVAACSHVSTVYVKRNKFTLSILQLFYANGIIKGFTFHSGYKHNSILVFLKYHQNLSVFSSLKIMSTPGRRYFWSLNKLSVNHDCNNFGGFYIISTPKGLLTSNDCLLYNHLSGEILLKVLF